MGPRTWRRVFIDKRPEASAKGQARLLSLKFLRISKTRTWPCRVRRFRVPISCSSMG